MSHEAREMETGVECFKEEEGVEKRRGFCLVKWFMEKKMLSVAGGGYLFIYYIYIYKIIYLYIYLYNFFNKSCKPSYIYDIKHVVFQYHHNKKESSKEKLKTVQ